MSSKLIIDPLSRTVHA